MKSLRAAWFLAFLLGISALPENKCPIGCECDVQKTKLRCSGTQWQELKYRNVLSTLPTLQQLDLSKNGISYLGAAFLNAPTLKKLILSENKIKVIDSAAFSNVTGITTLDLSSNGILNLSRELLKPLKLLERLKMKGNQLKTLEHDIFKDLTQIRMIDLSDNPWNCDCALLWMTDWIKNAHIKIPPAKCVTPEHRSGMPLRRLDYKCSNMAGLELEPSQDQVVFAGDSLSLRCRGDGFSDRVKWVWQDFDPRDRFSEVDVSERTVAEHGIIESVIYIDKLQPQHSGEWICRQMDGGNHSAVVSVMVLSELTKYCPSTISRDNKGEYFWPRTVIGNNVELTCLGERVGADPGTASYSCGSEGVWEDLDTSACSYISETTRILQQFVRDDLSAPREPINDKARILLNITSNTNSLTDPVDVIFVAQTVEKYCEFLEDNQDLSVTLTDIIASMQSVSSSLLATAEKQGRACSRLRAALEHVMVTAPSFHSQKNLLAGEVFSVQPDAFPGMACVWRRHPDTGQFHCSTSGRAVLDSPGRDLLAFVELPISLFSKPDESIHKLLLSMFPTGRMFQDMNEPGLHRYSSVVGVKIDDHEGSNLTEPIALMVTVSPGVPAEAVRWDSGLHGGVGGWTADGCIPSSVTRDHFLFHCYYLGYFSVRQSLTSLEIHSRTTLGVAAVYSGSFVLLVCLSFTILTYMTCHRVVQMSRRAKHAVANTWLSMFIECFLFTFGIFATEDVRVCEGLGLAVHYFLLSTLLWMVVTGNHMYKRLSRNSTDNESDDLPPGAPVQKPILGLYLVGWGIGLIVCGISGAVHLRDYAQPQFCFLGAGPALSAVLVPSGILIFILIIFFILSFCAIRNNDVNGRLSEGTQGTENVDLELLEDGTGCAERTERRSAKSEVTDSEDIEDPEHAPIIQLKAHIIVMVLFLLVLLTAALVTISDIHIIMPYQELIATGCYCIFAFFLGAFILYFYCVARSDVRTQWGKICRLLGSPARCCRSRSVSDNHASLPLQPATPHPVINNRPPSVNSGMTGRSSSSHRTKAVLELNNCGDTSDSISNHCKPTNTVNLVAMHRQLYRSNNSMPTYHEISNRSAADAFYNPRQSIVAKKFFKKQRRNRRNELGMRRRGDGGGTSDGEVSQCRRQWRPSAESAVFLSSDMENNSDKIANNIFGYSSKINNTNIHVGNCSRMRDNNSPKNPNVLSEEDEDKNSEKLLLARLVIGAEEDSTSAAHDLTSMDEESPTQAPDCRSVQLQCSLGDSSDALEGDDSFCQKIDSLQLMPDDSCAERIPPHYVTVLDPKYGVVKVTMNDYRQQSHRLRLASPSSQPGLPSTPEEGDFVNGQQNCSECDMNASQEVEVSEAVDITPTSLSPPQSLGSRKSSKDRRTPPRSLNLPGRNSPRRPRCRRSLPSSPEYHESDQVHRHSLPSSPEAHKKSLPLKPNASENRREQPRLNLPPPPDFPATSDEGTAESDGQGHDDLSDGVHEQWQKPEPPTSPASYRTQQPKPISEDLIDRNKNRLSISMSPDLSPDEPKIETTV